MATTEEERMRDCPYFGKRIYEGMCWDVVHCGRGEFNKRIVPEVTDWEKAIKLCRECPHQNE